MVLLCAQTVGYPLSAKSAMRARIQTENTLPTLVDLISLILVQMHDSSSGKLNLNKQNVFVYLHVTTHTFSLIRQNESTNIVVTGLLGLAYLHNGSIIMETGPSMTH